MATYSSKDLANSKSSTGLGGNYATQGTLSTFNFPVNGRSVETHIEVDSAGGTNSVALAGPDGQVLAYYNSGTNSWNAPAGQGNSTITQIIIPKIKSTPGLANALSQSAFYTAYNKTGNQAQATTLTGVSPSTPPPTVTNPATGLNGNAPGNQVNPGILNPLGGLDQILKDYENSPGDQILKSLGPKNNGFLKYPSDILETQQDVLIIRQFRYQPPRKTIFDNPGNVLQNGIERGSALKENLLTVILPIPNNLQDSNNVSWGPDNMNNLTAAAAGGVLANMAGVAGAGALGLGAGAILALLTGSNVGSAAGQGASLAIKGQIWKGLIDQIGKSQSAQALVGTGLASQALNMAGFEVSPESILSNAAGLVPNSNLELLFNAPTLREFRFDYRFSPRSEKEATEVKQIIRSFKQGMSPRKANSKSAGSASYFLATPNVFKLTYRSQGKDNIEGLNKFKICALTGFSVNYTPDGQWASYDKGQPVSYMVSMSFNELEPVYENDYQEVTDKNTFYKKDLESVGLNDVGY